MRILTAWPTGMLSGINIAESRAERGSRWGWLLLSACLGVAASWLQPFDVADAAAAELAPATTPAGQGTRRLSARKISLAARDPRPGPIDAGPKVLEAMAQASGAEIGLLAMALDDGSVLGRANERLPLNPASTMKLVTTYAALSMLGEDYRWRTAIHLDGTIVGDTLAGNLVVRGGGDPKLVIEDMVELVARMRASGLRVIRGNLLIDDSLYAAENEALPAFDGEPAQPYNVRPNAAMMNFKATRFVVHPVGRRIRIELDPPLADVRIVNHIRVLRGRCRHGADALTIADRSTPQAAVVEVGGLYSTRCGERGTFAAVLSHRQFIHGFFKAAWEAAGGRFDGRTEIARGAARGQPWLVWESPRTLAEVTRDVNKNSNNVMTRQLLLQVAATRGPGPASVDSARAMVRQWLAARGLAFPELVIENGSGLSREGRISARSLVRLLRDAATTPVADTLRLSLPVVGVDGTMRYRMRDEPIAGRAWIKTGSLKGVSAIAGYVDARSGRRYAVAMLLNGPRARGNRRMQDGFLRWVYTNG